MDKEISDVKKAEYIIDLLESIRLTSTQIKKATDNRDGKKTKELLIDYFVANLDTLNKIVVLKGIGHNFTKEELEDIKSNLLQLVK